MIFDDLTMAQLEKVLEELREDGFDDFGEKDFASHTRVTRRELADILERIFMLPRAGRVS